MIWFILVASLTTIASWWLVARPLLARPAAPAESGAIAQLRQQLAQLDSLHQAGTLSDAHYRESRDALESKIALTPAQAAISPARRPIGLALSLGLFLAVVVGAGYWFIGMPAALTGEAQALASRGAGDDASSITPEKIAAMVEKLAKHLKDSPNDAQGWAVLARTYVAMGRYDEAVDAYKRLVGLVHDDADVYADYAAAMAMANNRSLVGEPMKLVRQALAIDPNNLTARGLEGEEAFERQDYATAIKDWEQLAQSASGNPEFSQQVNERIAEARQRAAQAGIAVRPPATTPPVAAAAAKSTSVSGKVSLAPALAKQVAPTDTVFIFARAVQGPRMPLAIVRKQAKDLPFEFTLDDTTAMSPQTKLSNFQQVTVGARISKSGNAMPQPGDLQGGVPAVAVGATGVKIEISEVVK